MRPSLPLSLLPAVWLRSKEGHALLCVALICLDVDEHYQTPAKIVALSTMFMLARILIAPYLEYFMCLLSHTHALSVSGCSRNRNTKEKGISTCRAFFASIAIDAEEESEWRQRSPSRSNCRHVCRLRRCHRDMFSLCASRVPYIFSLVLRNYLVYLTCTSLSSCCVE